MRKACLGILLLLAGCAQAPSEAPADAETRDARLPTMDEVFSIHMGSPLTGACISAACGPAPTEPSSLLFGTNSTVTYTGFSFNITLEAVRDLGLQPRFTARCLETGFEPTPCPGVPDPLSTITGTLPLTWTADGFSVASPYSLLLEVRRDGQPSLTPLAVGEGTGDNYWLEGTLHHENPAAS